jgi:signal peptidase I
MADDNHPSSLQAGVVKREIPPYVPPHQSPWKAGLAELVFFLRWVAGLVLLVVCGWGFIALAAYFVSAHLEVGMLVAGAAAAVVSLGFILVLEHRFWLSRFMGLTYSPDSPAWMSAVFLWLLGVPGLLFRSSAEPAPATAAQADRKPSTAGTEVQTNSLREIVETVVFVVVLVLLLKSFSAEAFVIPTGSMATTLWGYQKDVVCPQCGFKFPVNCSDEGEGKTQDHLAGGTCPNCRFPIDFNREHLYLDCRTGDRVLVAKYFYDSGLVNPNRLDVVVFKYPEKPQINQLAQNYIKRLIGLPRETIGIYYGKLYVLSPDRGQQYPEDLTNVPEVRRWEWPHMHKDDAKELLLDPKTPFELVRKPPKKILSMRRIVFDNDFQPHDLEGKLPPRWADDGSSPSWLPDGPTGFRHPPQSGEAMAWLRYRHILRAGPQPELITDFMGYNSKVYGNSRHGMEHPVPSHNWVGDLILESEATVEEPSGELVLELSKSGDRFQARWDLTSGTCSLWRLAGGQEIKLASAATAVRKKGTYHLRFANVDERLTVWVDEKLAFGDGVIYDAPSIRRPTANDLQPASIGIQGGGVRVRKLQLWRDTYYTVTVDQRLADAPGMRDIGGGDEAERERRYHELLSNPDRWEEAFANMPSTTMYVQPGHYLCLGDNSPESSDGRSWGLVPNRLMLGRALLVYWPLGIFGGENRAGPIR